MSLNPAPKKGHETMKTRNKYGMERVDARLFVSFTRNNLKNKESTMNTV
jgi:hypothetical protein